MSTSSILNAFLGAFLLPLFCSAAVSDAACLTELTVPRYPELARQAHMQGVVKATLLIGASGRVDRVSIQTPQKLLELTIRRALLTVKISPSCHDTQVPLVFEFQLEDLVRPYDPGQVSYRAPLTFVIRAGIPPINEQKR